MATTKIIPGVLDLNSATSDKSLKMPSGTELNRPTNATGQIRNNTNETSNGSASQMEYYNGTDWKAITVGAFPPYSADFLVVAGGGGGGTALGDFAGGIGGGGAGAVGADGSGASGNGGVGLASSITGSSVTRGGGGGGALYNVGTAGTGGTGGGGNGGTNASSAGVAATVNTGGGGGGAHSQAASGAGGSGVVILRWATADATIGATRTGLVDGGVQTDGSDSYIVFTGGEGTITFS